jgi:ERCC4-type nuclease
MAGSANVYLRPRGTNTLTVHVKPVRAACPANQAALDRLQGAYVTAQANPNSNYVHTLRRAMKSLQACAEPVTTQREAQKLKHVGSAIARLICPNDVGTTARPDPAKAASAAAASSRGRKTLTTDQQATASARAPPRVPHLPPSPTLAIQRGASQQPPPGPTTKERAYARAKDEADALVLPPGGPWKVILLVDCREHRSKQVVSACKQSGIPCEERPLPIGDMAWIARCGGGGGTKREPPSTAKPLEIMVGTIVERKEVNDLACSLYGTRYNEQRLRLSQCGLPQVLFLVEGEVSQVINCPPEALHMAMMETRVQLGFKIIQTKHLTETVRVLKGLHRRIVQRTFPEAFAKESPEGGNVVGMGVPTYHQDPMEPGPSRVGGGTGGGRRRNRRVSSLLEMVFDTAPVPPFGSERFVTYPELKAKVEMDRERGTRSVRALTMAMLKQIPSLSQKKCLAIGQVYPTMNRLLEAVCYHCEGNPDKLLQSLPMDGGRRTIGPNAASEVCTACCTMADGTRFASHANSATNPSLTVDGEPNSSKTASKANKPRSEVPALSAKPKAKRKGPTTTAQAANARADGSGIVAASVDRYLSTALQKGTNSNDNTVEAVARRIMASSTTCVDLDPRDRATLPPMNDLSVEAISLLDTEGGGSADVPASPPPGHRAGLGAPHPVLFDLLTPEVKSATTRKTKTIRSTNTLSTAQTSLTLPSQDTSPMAPPPSEVRPAKRPKVGESLDGRSEQRRRGSQRPSIAQRYGTKNGDDAGAAMWDDKENQIQRDLKRAVVQASFAVGSSPESSLFSPTPRKEKAARKVSDEPVKNGHPGEMATASRKQYGMSPCSNSSSSSSDEADYQEVSTLRARLAKQLNREVISIDSD